VSMSMSSAIYIYIAKDINMDTDIKIDADIELIYAA
jgi:hypothetical protein